MSNSVSPAKLHPSIIALSTRAAGEFHSGAEFTARYLDAALETAASYIAGQESTCGLPGCHLLSKAIETAFSDLRTYVPTIRRLSSLTLTCTQIVTDYAKKLIEELLRKYSTYTCGACLADVASFTRGELIERRLRRAVDVIVAEGASMIRPGDTIVTYAKSALVAAALAAAHTRGTKFTVHWIDPVPGGAAYNAAASLAATGVNVVYFPFVGAASALHGATKVMVGGEAVTGEGSLVAPAGTALVTRLARQLGLPVIVLTEALKISTRVLGVGAESGSSTVLNSGAGAGAGAWLVNMGAGGAGGSRCTDTEIESWSFDVTNSHYIDAILTDIGSVSLPITSVPYVARELRAEFERLAIEFVDHFAVSRIISNDRRKSVV